MAKPIDPEPYRRSARIQVRIPVTLSGTLQDGKPFTEETYVTTVSKFGGKVKTSTPLKVGAEVTVAPRNLEGSARFRVVWVGREGSSRAGEIGIEYLELSNLLGVTFPE